MNIIGNRLIANLCNKPYYFKFFSNESNSSKDLSASNNSNLKSDINKQKFDEITHTGQVFKINN